MSVRLVIGHSQKETLHKNRLVPAMEMMRPKQENLKLRSKPYGIGGMGGSSGPMVLVRREIHRS